MSAYLCSDPGWWWVGAVLTAGGWALAGAVYLAAKVSRKRGMWRVVYGDVVIYSTFAAAGGAVVAAIVTGLAWRACGVAPVETVDLPAWAADAGAEADTVLSFEADTVPIEAVGGSLPLPESVFDSLFEAGAFEAEEANRARLGPGPLGLSAPVWGVLWLVAGGVAMGFALLIARRLDAEELLENEDRIAGEIAQAVILAAIDAEQQDGKSFGEAFVAVRDRLPDGGTDPPTRE